MEKGRFRDAVVCYKALLKTERRPEWLAGLASAYSGRAHSLADKGMLQEAIGLWRSRAELCGTPLWDGPFADWLLADGRIADVLARIAVCRAQATSADAPLAASSAGELARLEARLAPAVLAANPATLAQMPADSLLRLHQPMALAALTAYSGQNPQALEAALADIPFRSLYRDLRSLLKALVLSETDPQAARQALQRLPPGGPFESLAAPLRIRLMAAPERLPHWASLSSAQQTMTLDLLGYPPSAGPLLQDLAALASRHQGVTPAALFDLLLRHARALPAAPATRAWKWLSPWAVRQGCASPRLFGLPDTADQECATALAVEIKGEQGHANTHWLDAASRLQARASSHDMLRAALVLRHVALSASHLSSDGVLNQRGQVLLTKSLALDPDDCTVYVRLVQFWRRTDDLKNAREQLEAGLGRFPDDAALLTEAVETAVASGAFKKAATSARRLLAQDPLNRKVRALVGNAHLSHAVKQIASNKLAAAKKEIAEAANWLTASIDQGRMHLLQAWTEPVGSADRLRLAQLAASTWGGGVAAGWRLVREAQGVFTQVGLATAIRLLREAGLDATLTLTQPDLLDLLPALEQEPALLRKGMDPLVVWRKALPALVTANTLDADTCTRLCEAFSRHHELDLAQQCANAARLRWPGQPIFVYHAVAARAGKNDDVIDSEKDFDDLQAARLQADQNRDLRLSARIIRLCQDSDDSDSDEYDEDDEDDEDDEYDEYDLPSSLKNMDFSDTQTVRAVFKMMIQIDPAFFLKTARQQLGNTVFRQAEQAAGGDKQALVDRLLDLLLPEMPKSPAALTPPTPAASGKPNKPRHGQKNQSDE